jgi:predicted nuclease of restriction endonuclease-like RecB superfamily
MLTGKMVAVRYVRERIIPRYIEINDPEWREVAERLVTLFRSQQGQTRGQLEEELSELFGEGPGQIIHQGLAKLLEDRCEFEVVSGHPPEQVRAAVFRAAARRRLAPADPERMMETPFDRAAVLEEAAKELNLTPEAVEQSLFADLKSEQRLVCFNDISAEHLLQRYNVALAQAVLYRCTRLHVTIRNEPPQRYRQLLRRLKFHRLLCEMERVGENSWLLHVDGPLSLFSATQKYGLQLALFFPAVLLCRDFEVRAELSWGPQRKPKIFEATPRDGLVSHYADAGTYVPPELALFVELFRKRVADWDIIEETEILPLGSAGFWVPDFRLVHKATGRRVLFEVLGFWRRSSAEQHLARLRQHVTEPFLLAVSDQLHIEETELEGLPAEIHRFRNMPLPDEVARLAGAALRGGSPKVCLPK